MDGKGTKHEKHAHGSVFLVFGRCGTGWVAMNMKNATLRRVFCVHVVGAVEAAEHHQRTHLGTLVVFGWGGKVARHKNTSHMGHLCMSGCGKPTKDHQCAQMGTLVFWWRGNVAGHKNASHLGRVF